MDQLCLELEWHSTIPTKEKPTKNVDKRSDSYFTKYRKMITKWLK